MQSEIYHSISEIAKCDEICPAASFKRDRRGRRPRRPAEWELYFLTEVIFCLAKLYCYRSYICLAVSVERSRMVRCLTELLKMLAFLRIRRPVIS